MLMGSILQVEPEIVLTAQLVEVATGNVVASERLTGETGEKIFSLVDRLTVEIKKDLSLPSGAFAENDPRVVDITTLSEDAYRYYIEGRENIEKLLHDNARESFKKAIEIDSTFAMAYYGLSLGQTDNKTFHWAVENAVKYIDNANKIDQLYILSREASAASDRERAYALLDTIVKLYPDEKDAYFRLASMHRGDGDQNDKCIEYLLKVIEIDPLYKQAYNTLAYTYDGIGNIERSLWAINKYIEIAPDEANPYDTRAELFAANGRLDEAIPSYQKSIELNPDFFASILGLGYMHLYRQEYAKAESLFQEIAADDDKHERAEGRLALARMLQYKGKFRAALRMLEVGLETDRIEHSSSGSAALKVLERAIVFTHLGEFDSAVAEIDGAVERVYGKGDNNPGLTYQKIYEAYFCAASGDIARADSMEKELIAQTQNPDVRRAKLENHWNALGLVEFAKQDYDSALVYFTRYNDMHRSFWGLLMVARCHFGAERLGEAVSGFESALERYDHDRARVLIDAVKAHYWLGTAYEQSGWTAKAIGQYETFLEIWKDADEGIPEVEDARERLEKLRNMS
jgi:tetratricopeptide (TPR) repeat protein